MLVSPGVSIVIPTRNRSGLLRLTLHAALWQRGVDVEVIVVDDGSTDDTLQVIRGLGSERIRVARHEKPRGVSAARNRGIAEARGDWIAFLDDDDLWAPDKLASQLRAMGSDARWSYAGTVKIDGQGRIIGGAPPPPPNAVLARLRRWNLVPGGCSGVVVARRLLRSTGGFDPSLVNLADWDLWIRLGQHGPPEYVPEPMVGYRLHPGQASLDLDLILREAEIVARKHRTRLDVGALHHYLAQKALLGGNRRRALKHFAVAAMRGEAIPVVTDLGRRFGARLMRPVPPAASLVRWRAAAMPWLSALRSMTASAGPPSPPRAENLY
jgi:glycosyltransferase involved in cell wall biosynthesis